MPDSSTSQGTNGGPERQPPACAPCRDELQPDPPLPSQAPFLFRRQGRSAALGLAVICWLVALAFLGFRLQAAPWIVILFVLPTLPAAWDLWRSPVSGLCLTDDQISWFTGTQQRSLPLQDLASLRLDRRLDFSFRATLITTQGHKIPLPQTTLPPVDVLEHEIKKRGVTTERHHFTVI